MRLTEFKKLAPASVPVASIPFRGGVLDLFALRGEDIFWLIREAPAIAEAFVNEEGDVMQAIGEAGPEILNRILSVACRCSEADLLELDLSGEEELNILVTALEVGIPEDLLPKLFAGLRAAATRAGMQLPATATASFEDLSSASSNQESTPTNSRSSRLSSSALKRSRKGVGK